jgi:hypothetical protein
METPSYPHDEWVRRFAARLRELRPSVTEEAIEVGLVAFDRASDLDPDDAAGVFVEILNAGVPVHDLKRWTKESPR